MRAKDAEAMLRLIMMTLKAELKNPALHEGFENGIRDYGDMRVQEAQAQPKSTTALK